MNREKLRKSQEKEGNIPGETNGILGKARSRQEPSQILSRGQSSGLVLSPHRLTAPRPDRLARVQQPSSHYYRTNNSEPFQQGSVCTEQSRETVRQGPGTLCGAHVGVAQTRSRHCLARTCTVQVRYPEGRKSMISVLLPCWFCRRFSRSPSGFYICRRQHPLPFSIRPIRHLGSGTSLPRAHGIYAGRCANSESSDEIASLLLKRRPRTLISAQRHSVGASLASPRDLTFLVG